MVYSVPSKKLIKNTMRNNCGIVLSIFLSIFLIVPCKCRNNTGHSHNIMNFRIKPPEDPQKIIQGFGYPAETHRIVTDDGYVLTLHRIPRGLKKVRKKRPPVLLMHGLTFSSADFVNLDPSRSLGYILADMGYDVWLGNARGNSYSNKHVFINPHTKPEEFYDFSWHEIGYVDLPTKIDYILNVTKNENLYYIGHSQGCTVFYVMASMRPEYNKKIRLASMMAPAGYVSGTPEPFGQFMSQFTDEIRAFTSFFRIYHIPFLDFTRSYLRNFCQDDNHSYLCKELLYLIGSGYGDDLQLNRTIFPLIFRTTPSDASIKQFIHYFQEIKSGKFLQFDYGLEKNLKIYGQKYPPRYNISAISAPVATYYGKNDKFVGIRDIRRFMKKLSNVAYDYLIPYELFNHGDFLFATDVRSLVYNEMLKIMDKY